MDSITIKGNKEGIAVYINSDNFEDVKNDLVNRINNAKEFFIGCKIRIIDNKNHLTRDCYKELSEVLSKEFGIYVDIPKNEDRKGKKSNVISPGFDSKTKFIRNIIRSGQRYYFNGNIVIIGDVNSGAEVVATGNIVILGVLRGVAHAGYNGNKKAFVAAFKLKPSQLRIDDVIARSPDEKILESKIPEMAMVKNGIIVVEPYLPNKYI